MKFLLPLLLSLAVLLPVRGQQLAFTATEAKERQMPAQRETVLLQWQKKPETQPTEVAAREENESSGKYLLLKASYNHSAAWALDFKVPLARLEAEVPVHREVVHAGLLVLPALLEPSSEDSEVKFFWGFSGGIHFPFNKVLDPNDRFVWTGIKPFMRGYATIHTGSEDDDAEYDGSGFDWLFYAAYDIGVDWTLVRLGDCKLGLSVFNTNLKYWNFGVVLKLE